MIPRSPEPERGFVLAVLGQGADVDDELAEVKELARTAGVEPIAEIVQHRTRPAQRTYVGKGKLEELKRRYAESGAESLLVDDELDPAQQRFLENALDTRVIDRTQLILDIFAQHATTAEGKLQVELAQLEYNLPRMRGMWQHLERLGGGVGTRGPGESQLETDRRLARQRITVLKRKLKELEKQRATRRKERRRTETPTIALAGYTNVGKSTLLNRLTGSEVSVEDQLFHTLDPTTRGFEHDGRRYLVTDTVGFIRRLPHQLVEGFASTLEETLVADMVLHVIDGSAPDDEQDRQREAVDDVLHEIGAGELPVEVVLNKIDRVDPLGRRRLSNRFPAAPQVSALSGEGMDDLQAELARRFDDRWERVRLLVPYESGGRLSELYALGTPIEERADTPDGVMVIARLPRRDLPRFAPFLVAEASEPNRGIGLIELPIQKVRANAVVPERAYSGDAGLDLSSCDRVVLAPGTRALVPTGLAVAIPEGYAGYVQPRSGLASKHGISIVNTPGLVDSGYRGELLVNLVNTDRDRTFVVEPGMRIAQLVILELPDVELVVVDQLPASERGVRGFGSSHH